MSYKNASERNRRLKSRYKKLGDKMTSGVWYDENNERYREYHAPRRAKYLRNRSNRKVRRSKNKFGDYGTYKKVYDLWWELW